MIGTKRLVMCRLDGALTNAETLKMAAHALTVHDFQVPWVPFGAYQRLVGLSDEQVSRCIRELAGISHWKYWQYLDRFRAHYRDMAPLARPREGAIEMLSRLRTGERRVHVVVMSGSDSAAMARVLDVTGIDKIVSRSVSGDVVHCRQMLRSSYERVQFSCGYPADQCVAIDDSPAGCREARAAGMSVIGIRHSLNAGYELLADRVFDRIDPSSVIAAIEAL